MPQPGETSPQSRGHRVGPAKGKARGPGHVIGAAFLFVLGTGLMGAGVFGGPHDYVARAILFVIGFTTIVGAWDVLIGN